MATGMNAVPVNTALEIACLPDLNPELLALIEEALLCISSRDGTVSMQTVQVELKNRLAVEHLKAIFFSLAQAGVLTCRKRDRQGYTFDQYQVDPDRLRQTIHDAIVARRVLEQVRAEEKQAGRVELVATFPENLLLDTQIRHSILSLPATLHRLITEAEQEILILNPFFEQTGFDRLASALLAAAHRGVMTTIVTHQLSNPGSVNHQVLSSLVRQAATRCLGDHFTFWEYQQIEERRVVPAAHAKVLLIDGKNAYIGSANLTEYRMARFLEIGVLLQGPLVKRLRQIFQAILESNQAKQVTLES